MSHVVMPQMGESIAEGTIVRWIKKVGDKVDRDEPLFEISTDKVDAEIPSPAAGVLPRSACKEGETVPVNSVVAVIGAGRARPVERRRRRRPADGASPQDDRGGRRRRRGAVAGARDRRRRRAPPPRSRRRPQPPRKTLRGSARRRWCAGSPRSTASTSAQIHGTGIAGRVTKHDILRVHRQAAPRRRHADATPARPRGVRTPAAVANRAAGAGVRRRRARRVAADVA